MIYNVDAALRKYLVLIHAMAIDVNITTLLFLYWRYLSMSIYASFSYQILMYTKLRLDYLHCSAGAARRRNAFMKVAYGGLLVSS